MLKILQYYTQFNLGGTEKVIYSIFNNIDMNKFECYFLGKKKGKYDYLLLDNNVNLKIIEDNNSFAKNVFTYFIENDFDIIHVHNCEEMSLILKIAKKAGIKKRIAHSHVARNDLNKFSWLLKSIKSININYYANTYFACSESAAKWLFGVNSKKSYVMLNGININCFSFNEKIRNDIRKKFKIGNKNKLLIMVSRISFEKNHKFLIDVMEKLIKYDNSYKLFIIGDGPLFFSIKNYVNEKKLNKNIYMLGEIKNVRDFLSAADGFLMPSLYEGLGISAVEAQYNGLYCLCSDRIPFEVDIEENLCNFLPLSIDVWVSKILSINVRNNNICIQSDKYDIKKIVSDVEREYLK